MADNVLTEKQLAFCREYIIDFNGSAAAIRAGYAKRSASTAAARLLVNDKVQSTVNELIKNRSERTGITADRVVQQLAKIAFMDIKSVVDWGTEERTARDSDGKIIRDKDGNPEKENVHYIRPQDPELVDGTLIQSVKMTKYGFNIEIPDRMRAFEILAKHTGVYDDRPQMTVDIKPYADALKQATENANLWDGFDNSAPGSGESDE